jgi:hypothetical protein
MTVGITSPADLELDGIVDAFESAQIQGESPELTDYLPAPPHPRFLEVLRELVRVDLEYSWKLGRPKRVEDYQRHFPQLFIDEPTLHQIAYEEYRLRCQAGECPSPLEYYERLGLSLADWPGL